MCGIGDSPYGGVLPLGRIPGASRFGRFRALPADAEKPADPRTQKQEGRRQT